MKAPSFPLYVNNWLASSRIASMSPEQEGAYIRLLCYAWNSDDGGLNDDDVELAALSRLNEKWETLGKKIKQCFRLENGRLYSERLSACFSESADYRKRQSELAVRRWQKHGKKQDVPSHMPRHKPSEVTWQCSDSDSESESYIDSESEKKSHIRGGVGEKDMFAPDGATDSTNAVIASNRKTWKQWTPAELLADVERNNSDGLLTEKEVSEFVEYWTEPSATGRLRFALERTWETRRRMQTALRMVYEKQRAQHHVRRSTI